AGLAVRVALSGCGSGASASPDRLAVRRLVGAESRLMRGDDMTDSELWTPHNEGQLSAEDALDDRGLDDALDEGYSPPERYRGSTAFGVTAAEARRGEPLDQRLRPEVPDDTDDGYDLDEAGEFFDANEVGGARSGRLVAPDEGLSSDIEQDSVGRDVGIDGGAASAEEAAVHIVELP